MSDTTASVFVRGDLVAERPAPVKTTGFIGFLRTRLFNSPTNILLTIVSALLLWFTVIPALKFLLVDAVWTGKDRTACLAENAGHVVGACWPFIQAKFTQFIYGFYPEAERWRVNLTFILAAILLLPLLIPRLPAKGLNAGLFFGAFPVVAFFLLHGGGLDGLGVSWTAGLLSGFNDSIGDGGRKLAVAGENTAVIGPLLWLLGKLIVLVSTMISWLLLPLTWLRDQIQSFGRPVWADFVLSAIIACGLVFWLGAGIYWIESFFFPLDGLRLLVLPLACVASVMPLVFGGVHVLSYSAAPMFKLHFLIANIAYGLFAIAALHAILMLMVEKRLQNMRGTATRHTSNSWVSSWLDTLPPLLTLEKLLFRLISAGFVLLTLTLISGVAFNEQLVDKAFKLDHKTVFAILSWLMFGALLFAMVDYFPGDPWIPTPDMLVRRSSARRRKPDIV